MFKYDAQELVTGDGCKITSDEISKLYRDVVSLSLPTGGVIRPINDTTYSLRANFSATCCDISEEVTTSKIYSLTTDPKAHIINNVHCLSLPMEPSTPVLLAATSINGKYTARLRSCDSPSSQDEPAAKQLLEIWDNQRLLKTIKVSEVDSHGHIVVNSHFSTFVWSPFQEQDKLLYICQQKKQKTPSFFQSNQEGDVGGKFVKRDSWGECLTNIDHTVIAVLDVANDFHIKVINLEGFSLANSQWLDNGQKVVSTAYVEESRKLGITYCNNRPQKIVIHQLDKQDGQPILELYNPEECYHTPRVNHSGNSFIYLSNPVYGIHNHAVSINLYNLQQGSSKPLRDDSGHWEFFIQSLPTNCFTSDDKHIILNTQDHLQLHISLFSLETSTQTRIAFPTTDAVVLDFQHDLIFALGSEINATPTLMVAMVNPEKIGDVVAWHQIEDCLHLEELEYESYKIDTTDKSSYCTAVLIKPDLEKLRAHRAIRDNAQPVTSDNHLPTVVILHGGPNSSLRLRYLSTLSYYARLGLKSLLINYRGSSGVSESYTKSLSGKVGELDVEDCMTVIRHLVERKVIDPEKLILSGGSHGGFLAGHLSCQTKFKFTSAIIRNPVLDILSSFATTDIPDWVTNVALGYTSHNYDYVPTKEDIMRMYDTSATYKCNSCTVPTFMALGSEDLRVRMFQGERWVDNLKARGVDVLCKVYPDNHGLSKPEVATDYAITSALWILTHLQRK